ncbi:MAG: right-handed parallel beta-helix repeat-containing protein [Chloroflexi bacterium]|nr:right-handed parallel beta-helix repeat-containing protein [Chloroflexota bacterium]
MKQRVKLVTILIAFVVIALLTSLVMPVVTSQPVTADTTVGGQITSDTTWTKANSPYIVGSGALISPGVTLTIEQGVVVKFISARGMQVEGQLIARGTVSEPIVFTSDQPSPAPGDWVNILFMDSSVDAVYDGSGNYVSGSIMQYCAVEYGGNSNLPALKIVKSSPFIDHCTVRNNASSGIYVEGEYIYSAAAVNGLPRIVNNTVTGNAGHGIYAGWNYSWDAKYGTCIITNNTVSGNSANGILSYRGIVGIIGNTVASNSGIGVQSSGGTAVITGNTVSTNSGGGIYSGEGTVTISGNTISGNTSSGITISSNSTATISGNNISGNSTQGSGGGICAYDSTVVISGNSISGNVAQYSGGGIYTYTYSSAYIEISGNTVSYNAASSEGGGIYSYGNVVFLGYNDIISNSMTSGNGKGGGVYVSGQPVLNFNNIHGNTPYDVYDANAQGSPHVDATSNWWGTVDEVTIQSHIWDWYDHASLGIVDYNPSRTGSAPLTSFPYQPTNIAPSSGAYNITATPTLQSSPFSDADSGDAHAASQWQVALWPSNYMGYPDWPAPAFDSGTDNVNLTQVIVPTGRLSFGTFYGWRVRYQDNHGAWSRWSSPTSFTTLYDYSPPTTPTVADDGDWTTSKTQLHAAWNSSDPESGIAEYQYAIGTSAGGTDVVDWTSAGTSTEVTHSGLSLNVGTTYYFSVKAKNGTGGWSSVGTSNGITISDSTAPTTPVVTDDGANTTSTTQLHALWSSSDSESGIAEYQYAIGTSAGGTDVVGWTSAETNTEVTRTGLSLTWGTSYYFAVNTKNGHGLWSEIGVSNGITVSDPTPPTTPVVTDDGDTTSNPTQLHAAWSSSDPESGIAEYQYAVGTSAGDTDVVGWTSAGTNTEVTSTGLSLTWGATYYISVKAKNNAGSWSSMGTSNGIAAYTLPVADFSAAPTECLPSQVIAFTSLCSGGKPPLIYAWDFNNDGTVDSTDQNPTHSYASSGTYTVSLKVTDADGKTDTETKTNYITIIKAATQEDVTAQGGRVETTDGQIATEFPAGCLGDTATVTIKQLPASSAATAPQGFRVGNTCFRVEVIGVDGVAMTTFAEPITITVKYTDEDVTAAGDDPNNLVLAYWDEAAGEWVTLPTTVDTTEMTLSTTTSHLSQWAILAKTPSESLAGWIWIVVGIGAVLGAGILAYFIRRRLVRQ